MIANIKDAPKIYELIKKRILWFKENQMSGWGIGYLEEYNLEYIKENIKNATFLILKEKEHVVGALLLNDTSEFWPKDTTYGYLHHFVTDPDIPNIGKALLEEAIALAKQKKLPALRLDCFSKNKFLNDYYTKHGFQLKDSGFIEDYTYNLYEYPLK